MESQQLLNGKIIEIGCGKDIFKHASFTAKDVTGFDPTYEGGIRNLLSGIIILQSMNLFEADFIVLRHTLNIFIFH